MASSKNYMSIVFLCIFWPSHCSHKRVIFIDLLMIMAFYFCFALLNHLFLLEAFLTFFHHKAMILGIYYVLRIFEISETLEKDFSSLNVELSKMMEASIFLNLEAYRSLEKWKIFHFNVPFGHWSNLPCIGVNGPSKVTQNHFLSRFRSSPYNNNHLSIDILHNHIFYLKYKDLDMFTIHLMLSNSLAHFSYLA